MKYKATTFLISIMLLGLASFWYKTNLISNEKHKLWRSSLEEEIQLAEKSKGSIETWLIDIRSAKDLSQVDYLSQEIEKLPEKFKKEAGSIITYKKALFSFQEGESALVRAIELNQLKVLKEAERNFIKAQELYKQAKIYIDEIQEINNEDFNHSFYYLKGEVYHRIIQIIASPEEAQEILPQALAAYKKALLFKEQDVETEINVELLLKEAEDSQKRRPEAGMGPIIDNLSNKGIGTGGKGKGNF